MKKEKPKFQKVGECLYRYSSNGVYYARIKSSGKEIWRSLRTTNQAFAKRQLAKLRDDHGQVDHSRGKLTLRQLCDDYEDTIRHQRPKTIERKELILRRIREDWPTGIKTQIQKVKASHVDRWLSRYDFGAASRNLHIALVKDIFNAALRDGAIARSPAAHLTKSKAAKPIRQTPSFEEFQAIVESIRSQQFNGHDAEESADFVAFLGLAGLGQAEVSALKLSDVNWKKGTVTTYRHKTKSGFEIPIYPQLRPLLDRRTDGLKNPGDSLFEIKNAKKCVAAACRRLNLPNYSQRSFRRMFVTRAIERGIDVKVIAEWQGHKDGGALILRTYSHVRPIHSQRMAQLMTTEEPENVVQMPATKAQNG
jgi:integrase